MKYLVYTLIYIPFLVLHSCLFQTSKAQIVVDIPTIEQEATSIWRTINDIEFLEQQKYNINLPQNDVIKSLIQKSRNKEFGNSDFEEIYTMLESGIYDPGKYDAALKKVKSNESLINSMVAKLKEAQNSWSWDFKTFDKYDVVFTLYGTGGSYDPEIGLVTLFTNEKGGFMKYENPANTIIHEIVHMGIERSIVREYNISHGLKERIVDKITCLLFCDDLKDYRIQNMGDSKIDKYLSDAGDLKDLKNLIITYQKEN